MPSTSIQENWQTDFDYFILHFCCFSPHLYLGRCKAISPDYATKVAIPIVTVEITLEEAVEGCVQEIKLPNNPDLLQVTIPAGIDEGQRVRVNGKGNPGSLGGGFGDLLVEVNLVEHDVFRREGRDLHCLIETPFTTAALGDSLKVPTFAGFINIKIPQGTQAGRKFRIKGKGIKAMKGDLVGDLIYEVIIPTPTTLSDQQRTLLEQLAELS